MAKQHLSRDDRIFMDGKVISAELPARMLNRERFPVAIWREVAAALDKMERKKGADTDGKDN